MNTSEQMTLLGWRPHFQTQLQLEELENHIFGKIVEHTDSDFIIQFVDQQFTLTINEHLPAMCVGDWLVFKEDLQFVRALESFSSFSRNITGDSNALQIIASNIDTVFIVSALNQDFNLNRIERFLALAHDAEVQAVVVLTKKDLCANWESYLDKVQALDSLLIVEAVNALDAQSIKPLLPWCEAGQTIACLGASGVGKSTLINTLDKTNLDATKVKAANNNKNKHTTAAHSLCQLASGMWLMDTPGMREIELLHSNETVDNTFSDISALAQECRFSDCKHQNEPGCKIRAAIASKTLDAKRFNSYQKLLREQANNSENLEEERSSGKKAVKLHKTIQREARNTKGKSDDY